MPRRLTLEIANLKGERADVAILRTLGEFPSVGKPVSRARLKEFFQRGDVRLGGRALAAADELRPGQVEIEIRGLDDLVARERALPSSRGAFLPIVYEDADVLVLHKLSGVPSLPHSQAESGDTAVGAALARVPELPVTAERELEPGLLHRLDTGTSGLLVFAKTPGEWARLREEWRSGGVRKFYRACVQGVTPPRVIDTPLAHDAKSAKRMIAIDGRERDMRGRPLPAHTEILEANLISGDRSDLLIRIETGVMHQIRCHLASIGHAIIGDPIYGDISAPRLWLHAWRIELPLASGARLALEAALPSDWPR